MNDASNNVDEKSKTKKRPKYSTRGAAKTSEFTVGPGLYVLTSENFSNLFLITGFCG